jgi:hypothetical protein
MGDGNANNCTTSVCGNAVSQHSVNSISGSAISHAASDVFANNPPIHEQISRQLEANSIALPT